MTIIPDRGYTSKVGCVSNQMKWDLSSAGRASALQAEGHRFEPYRSHPFQNLQYGEIAQLARAHGSYPWCRGFESPSRYFIRKSRKRCKINISCSFLLVAVFYSKLITNDYRVLKAISPTRIPVSSASSIA